jgi:glycosyltransferase involved in cell wall biosynthesis
MILDPGLRRRLAEAGAQRLMAEYSPGRVVEQWRDLLAPYGVG